ncbi:ABC transporter ATP-binding protein [Citricoccus nitrophenolicus]|uniref:ABC transporter ATP-binding protein n=1 Tax=Citricoccus nitrophenolicus TaxID=863575 RepID=UPI0039B6C6C4
MSAAPEDRAQAEGRNSEDSLLEEDDIEDAGETVTLDHARPLDRTNRPALVLDRVSMTYKVPSTREEVADNLPWYKKAVYGLVRRQPRVSVRALRELSIVVGEGESLGIVGRNGSGKSTLSKVISGKLMPTTGEVWSSGTPMLMGVNAALVPAISGRQNIILGCLALGMSRAEIDERLPEIEESTGLDTAIHLPIDTYSSGMSARLRFAIATSRNPEVLVIDEALNVGDARFRERSQERMKELRDQAGCVVLVSHSRKTIENSCSRVLWLDNGFPLADGDPDEVLEGYARYNFLLAKQRLKEAEEHVNSFRTSYRNVTVQRT